MSHTTTNSPKFKIAFASSSDFCLPIAQYLFDNQGKILRELVGDLDLVNSNNIFDLPIELSLIISQPNTINRGKVISNPIVTWAKSQNLNIWTPQKFNPERQSFFDSLGIDIVVTASFGQLVSSSSLLSTPFGFINWHPSLLPLYRGATPLQSTIFNGDKQCGLTWITMTKGMDEGAILLQIPQKLEDTDTFLTKIYELGRLGGQTVISAIVNQILGKGTDQDVNHVVFCSKLDKEDRFFDPKLMSAQQVFNKYKAHIQFPQTVFVDEYFGCEVKINSCDITNLTLEKNIGISFGARFGDWLVIKESKRQVVFLICKDENENKTYLEVHKITLSSGKNSGKQINFSGYQFEV